MNKPTMPVTRVPLAIELREVLIGICAGALARYPKESIAQALDDVKNQVLAIDVRAIKQAQESYAQAKKGGHEP